MIFVPKGSITKVPALVQIMAWRRPGDKPLSEPMMVSLLTHIQNDICVTQPQWVKPRSNFHLVTLTYFWGKYCFVMQLVLYPRHEVINIFRGRALDRFLDGLSICPMVLIFGAGWHDRTGGLRAELCHCTIQHVDLVEKVNRCKDKVGLYIIFDSWDTK